MTKAYDFKELGAMLKAEGLEIVEENLKIIVNVAAKWAEISAKLGQHPIADGIVLMGSPIALKVILPQIEKINPAD